MTKSLVLVGLSVAVALFSITASALFIAATIAAINEGSLSVVNALVLWGFVLAVVAVFTGIAIGPVSA